MVLGTAWGLSNGATIALAVALAFAFGYALTLFAGLVAFPLNRYLIQRGKGHAVAHQVHAH